MVYEQCGEYLICPFVVWYSSSRILEGPYRKSSSKINITTFGENIWSKLDDLLALDLLKLLNYPPSLLNIFSFIEMSQTFLFLGIEIVFCFTKLECSKVVFVCLSMKFKLV